MSSYHGSWYQNKTNEGGWTGNKVYIPSSTYETGKFVGNELTWIKKKEKPSGLYYYQLDIYIYADWSWKISPTWKYKKHL